MKFWSEITQSQLTDEEKTSDTIKLYTESGKPCTESTRIGNDIQRKPNPEIPTFLLHF